jgi:putative transposase
MTKPANPFRYFNSSPEVIRLVVMMYVKYPLSLRNAALKFMKRLMKRHGTAQKITTDGLRSYKAAMKDQNNAHKQAVGRWANNRVENSHQPLRRRERAMLRFRRMKTLQQFASVHASVHNLFNQERHLTSRQTYNERRSEALSEWRSVMD